MIKTTDLENQIIELLEGKKYKELKEIISTINPYDLAALFEDLPEKNIILLFRLLPKDLAAETFVEMNPEHQKTLIESFSDVELKEVIDELYIDDMVYLIEEMPANVVKRILKNSSEYDRKIINQILNYPQDSAGSIMTTEFVSLRSDMTIADAIKRIRQIGLDSETFDTCYVTDNVNHLIGYITIRTIILSDDNSKIEDLMETNVISVNTHDDQEEVAHLFGKYDLTVLPVVDNDNRLVGIVTVDDAWDVLEKETTEDIELMAAITPSDTPYLKKTIFEIWRSRMPWLLLLMISATFTGLIITRFEDALKAYVVLTAYIPMLMDTGGNSGSQSSVTIIRGLSLNEIEFGDILKVLWKESRVAMLCGITLAVVNFAKLMVFDKVGFGVAVVVNLTLLLTVIIAKMVGSTLPMLAKKIGFDPAVMASPFITTIVDAISLILYFAITGMILGL
ncbi:magnesium transporter [Herbinix hemicellulosilytica]|uniref:Magnesium transporter MgtE n=1 Tax=Herbinix hemicellulosilytica TaxID=1564487 RepID=A0A0H5SDN5_HERHM|nr:magnesium transporter [Herbinix hemicellulosilytica]RBP56881.1 magnesium transporter [Herbinix hemicellulosilytica]CRZ33497.1 putative membrane protein [Herbinix hemicellulosilytica]